jgi:L-asparaginase
MVERETPRIRLLMGPGTLPSQGVDRLDLVRYRHSGRPRMTGAELLAAVPEISQWAKAEVDEGNPYEIARAEDLRALALRMNELLASPDIDGIVFVQGTNSIEETAYFLTLTVRSSKPIVVTGAQRPFTGLSSDAAINLLDACRVAACAETCGKGVVVVANSEINSAREVTKTNTYHVHTFRSRDLGLLGYADADTIAYYRTPTRRHTAASEFDVSTIRSLPRVDVLYVCVASEPGSAEAALRLGAKGIVVAGTGAGSCGNLETELARIAAECRAVVVRASRVGEGRVIRDDGWQRPGMVAADNLPAHKAALLLSLALTRTGDPDEIQHLFDEY